MRCLVAPLEEAMNRALDGLRRTRRHALRVDSLMLVLGAALVIFSAPQMTFAGTLSTGTANGLRSSGNEVWTGTLACPVGTSQTPLSGKKVCSDSAGTYTACTSDGECPPSTSGVCCALVILLAPAGGPSSGYPHPGTKGDCVSCDLVGECIVQITPATGDGPIQAVRACD